MVTKHQLKLIKSLSQKKYRQQLGLFTVEGIKGIEEFLNSNYQLETLFTSKPLFNAPQTHTVVINNNELQRISSLKKPNTALALFKIPKTSHVISKGLIVALDDVRDPGNLGTIIRLCDWYGIKDLVCSNETVDCYNSKVVQATMGSLTRINITYLDLEHFIDTQNETVFGTFMKGDNIYTSILPDSGVIVLGNEANGISEEIQKKINKKLTIPQFGTIKETESLNVANATAIILSEFKRRSIEM
jgi:TrmH family RNA methyltransferase